MNQIQLTRLTMKHLDGQVYHLADIAMDTALCYSRQEGPHLPGFHRDAVVLHGVAYEHAMHAFHYAKFTDDAYAIERYKEMAIVAQHHHTLHHDGRTPAIPGSKHSRAA